MDPGMTYLKDFIAERVISSFCKFEIFAIETDEM